MSTCHNWIKVSSFGLNTTLVGDALYYITSHLLESTKKTKEMHVNMPHQGFKTFLEIPLNPQFEIKTLFNEFWNERSTLGNHKCLHQVSQDVFIIFLQNFGKISKTFLNVLMCVSNN